jgi:hypothetical protein
MAVKKGDRVEWTDPSGDRHLGVIAQGGRIATAIIDGGIMKATGPGDGFFKLSSEPLPSGAPHEMDAFGIKGYKAIESQTGETEAFSATLTMNGKPIARVTNDGCGGCHRYYPADGMRQAMEIFHATARKWAADHNADGASDIAEPADAWFDWKAHKAPYGMTGRAYLETVASMFAEFAPSM